MTVPKDATGTQDSSRGPLFYAGASALLIAMLLDAAAVAGRHLGIPLLGSLELVQAMMLIAASAAIVSTTLANKHAAVHLLLDRLTPPARRWLQHVNSILSCVFLLALAAGSAWIAIDAWGGHEESELLHIPYAPLRIVSIAALLLAAAASIARLLTRRKP